MSDEQTAVIADLRYPAESLDTSEGRWAQWSSLSMIELSALDTYQYVQSMLPHSGLRILEIGCGNGYLTLELARDGHEVIGLDKSPEIITVAERTRAAHPDIAGFGKLTYFCADIETWQAPKDRFDVVIITRTLHHIHHLHPILTKIRHLLTDHGQVICQDYAYDHLSEKTATWMYSMQRLLYLSGLSDEDPATAASDARSIEALKTAWFQKSDHRLNRYEEMMQAFAENFQEQFRAWVPYLFVYIGNGVRHTAEQKSALLAFLRGMEQYLIESGDIQAVGFRYVGWV